MLLALAGHAFNAAAQTDTNLYSFGSSPNDGAAPEAGLVQASDGNFYGTTYFGGTSNKGTVFRFNPSGTYTTLYSFAATDGNFPKATLVQGSDGNFYGTTYHGGTSGNGTVFRISPSGTYTTLYSFVGPPNDGEWPEAGLVQGSDGNFYGTTYYGGTSTNCGPLGCGTVFRISPGGTYTNLYSFAGSPNDGANPKATLVQGADGNFYGTTFKGGTNCLSCGPGTVFRISPSGSETNLHSFFGSANFATNDGSLPEAGLVQGSDGNLYGTASVGGQRGWGTLFRINPSGTYTSLYSFLGYPNDGAYPDAGLVQGSDGNFYGTTGGGGTSDNGIVFWISPSGTYTTLYSFVASDDETTEPYGTLVQGRDGNF